MSLVVDVSVTSRFLELPARLEDPEEALQQPEHGYDYFHRQPPPFQEALPSSHRPAGGRAEDHSLRRTLDQGRNRGGAEVRPVAGVAWERYSVRWDERPPVPIPANQIPFSNMAAGAALHPSKRNTVLEPAGGGRGPSQRAEYRSQASCRRASGNEAVPSATSGCTVCPAPCHRKHRTARAVAHGCACPPTHTRRGGYRHVPVTTTACNHV